jgi:hypothetical protein
MKVFLLDLWLDLREKRLLPVALLLLAGVIAVPIVLANNDETPPPPPTATTAAAPTGPVVQSESEDVQDSRLQTFSARDPFEPTSAPASTTTGTSTTTTTGGTTGTSTTPSSTTGTTGGGTTPSGGGTTGTEPTTGTGNSGNTTGETKATLFTYTTDLKFGQGGDVKTYKSVKRLELIPDEKNPKIVFLGVTTTAKTAVFLVDSNIGVDTADGRCRPSADECTFLYLRPDKDHDEATLTDSDGTVYHLRLLEINRVTVSSANGNTNSGNSKGNTKSNRSPAFTGNANSKNDEATVPGETPPGEPGKSFTFRGFFRDSAEG